MPLASRGHPCSPRATGLPLLGPPTFPRPNAPTLSPAQPAPVQPPPARRTRKRRPICKACDVSLRPRRAASPQPVGRPVAAAGGRGVPASLSLSLFPYFSFPFLRGWEGGHGPGHGAHAETDKELRAPRHPRDRAPLRREGREVSSRARPPPSAASPAVRGEGRLRSQSLAPFRTTSPLRGL